VKGMGGDDDLTEVPVNVYRTDDPLAPVKVNVSRVPEPIEEIVVQARRVPWFVWAGLGAIVAAIVFDQKR